MTSRPIIFLALAQTLVWAGLYYSFPALLLEWEHSLGWKRSELTLAFTLCIIVSAVLAPMAGRLIDRGFGHLLMSVSTILGGLCLMLLSVINQLWQFYLAWIFIGATLAGCLYDPCFSLVTRSRGVNARSAITLITLVAGFAGTISFPTAHALSQNFGWQPTVQIFGTIILLIAAPLMWLGASQLESEFKGRLHKEKVAEDRAFLGYPMFWLLGTGFGLAALLHGVTLHHLLPILNERLVDASFAVIVASLIGPMQVVGRLFMLSIQNKVTNHGLVVVCFLMLATSIIALMFAGQSSALLILFVTLFGAAYGMVSIARPVIARDLLGQISFGAKSGVLSMLYLIGGASAPFIGSLLWSVGGYEFVLPFLLAIAAAGLGCYWQANRLSAKKD